MKLCWTPKVYINLVLKMKAQMKSQETDELSVGMPAMYSKSQAVDPLSNSWGFVIMMSIVSKVCLLLPISQPIPLVYSLQYNEKSEVQFHKYSTGHFHLYVLIFV